MKNATNICCFMISNPDLPLGDMQISWIESKFIWLWFITAVRTMPIIQFQSGLIILNIISHNNVILVTSGWNSQLINNLLIRKARIITMGYDGNSRI